MGVLRPESVTIFIFLYEHNNNVLQLILETCSYMDFIRLVDILCCYCQKLAFLGNFGGKKGILGSQGVTIFIFLYEDNNNVLHLILETCSCMVFIRLVDVLCCYCQKIALLGHFGGQKGNFRVSGCYYFHIFASR